MAAESLQTSRHPRYLAEHEQKELLRLVVVGSVDDGKSTLIGRLLHECGRHLRGPARRACKQAPPQQNGRARSTSRSSPMGSAPSASRASPSTSRTATSPPRRASSSSPTRRGTSSTRATWRPARRPPTRGHPARRAPGRAAADAGGTRTSRRCSGFPSSPSRSTRWTWSTSIAAVFDAHRRGASTRSRSRCGFERRATTSRSARAAATTSSARSARTPWHDGGTLLEWLERCPTSAETDEAPVPLPRAVRAAAGPRLPRLRGPDRLGHGARRATRWWCCPPDAAPASPASTPSKAASTQATAPASVTLRLADEVDVSRGDLLAHRGPPVAVQDRLEAMLVWFGETRRWSPGPVPREAHHSNRQPRRSSRCSGARSSKTSPRSPPKPCRSMTSAGCGSPASAPCSATRTRRTARPARSSSIDPLSNDTVAAGMIVGPADHGAGSVVGSLVTGEERRARLGQSGAVVLLPPPALAPRNRRISSSAG